MTTTAYSVERLPLELADWIIDRDRGTLVISTRLDDQEAANAIREAGRHRPVPALPLARSLP